MTQLIASLERTQQDLVRAMFMKEEKEAYFLKTCVSIDVVCRLD